MDTNDLTSEEITELRNKSLGNNDDGQGEIELSKKEILTKHHTNSLDLNQEACEY